MSSNKLNDNKPFVYCQNNDCNFNINNQTNLEQDSCEKVFRDKQSESPGIYRMNRYNDSTCGIPTVMEVASQNPTIIFKDGYGITECYVDDDSKLRIGKTKKILNVQINFLQDHTEQSLIWEEARVIHI